MELFEAAHACRRCPSVSGCAVLGAANGPAPAPILFVGEAPGRLGAGRTGIPFSGDESGHRFEHLLAAAGLLRSSVFITNAILCLPLDAAGRNRAPLRSELANCATHLADTIAHVDPQIVVTLGATALGALTRIAPHNLKLATAVAQPVPWHERTLIPLYHPGRRAEIHRAWPTQLADWQALGLITQKAQRARGSE